MAVFLCATALAGCASGIFNIADASNDKPAAAALKTAPIDLESGIHQAQTLRTAGQYDDAIHILSQLMLVNSDDPRVVAEYGKALAQKGRAKDATDFLNRAIELSANDWTLYSALGVSYDQLGNQTAARTAYEHALVLKPNEPSVLNNYALSRMMADDGVGARALMARAQAAGGASDSKIAANIALVNKLASTKPDVVAVPPKTAAAAAPAQAQNASVPAAKPVATASLPSVQNAPRSLAPSPQQAAANGGVVMQAVPVDPLAGPVKAASHKLATVKTDSAKPDAAKADMAKDSKTADAQASKPADAKPVTANPAALPAPKTKTADQKDQVPALRLTANALTP
jgi:Flp pilus assembly protein TadD